ncbi:MAG: 50S ribosomal protein L16 [bacterium (Candidatus Stahlbacteria) CG23_combo_of_CG06-09_8_20_14_all_34_7]|nr:MAG: 50S ribosomal protein L16 [bacterium (Candidatus Stahlbacteria) CG23_combo_of_CG06-09_8_20_14_all_34_7]
MLIPKRVKYRKQQRGRRKGVSKGGFDVSFGDFGIQSLDVCWITARQIEAARVAIQRTLQKDGKLWVKVFPDKPVTKKPAETRMGKGKGAPEYWVAVIKPGKVLFEMAGINEEVGRKATELASHKLPVRVRFVKREGVI